MIGLIAIEGIDGSGKSTLAAGLADALRAMGTQTLLLRPLEPESCLLPALRASHARVAPDLQLSAAREAFLAAYFGYRLIRSAECDIRPALASGSTVICDRYVGSHRVNQKCFGQEVGVFEPLFRSLPTALTLFVQVPVAVAAERLARRHAVGAGDGLAFAIMAASQFEELAAAERWTVLDGTCAASRLVAAAIASIKAIATVAGSPAQ
jgi:dTMP kinase